MGADDEARRKAAAIDFLRRASAGDVRAAFEGHAAPAFRHHNAFFPAGADALAAAMARDAKEHPRKTFTVLRAIAEGDLVAVHSRVRLRPEDADIAVVHLFRFEGDRIAELWDVGQPAPAESPNRDGMF